MGKIENVIYILTNPQYPGYIKIGYASDLKQRLVSLNTGALVEFVPYAVYETSKINGDIEIHRIIELLNPILRASKFNNGKSKLKEFFKLEAEEAYELLYHIAIVSGTEKHLYKVDNNLNKITEEQKQPEPIQKGQLPDGEYSLSRKLKKLNIVARGKIQVEKGVITLKAGSYISPLEGHGLSSNIIKIRKQVKITNNILQEDIICSLNEAACVILGMTADSWVTWKDSNGDYINKYRKTE